MCLQNGRRPGGIFGLYCHRPAGQKIITILLLLIVSVILKGLLLRTFDGSRSYGKIIAEGGSAEEIIYCDIDLAYIDKVRARLNALADVRKELI